MLTVGVARGDTRATTSPGGVVSICTQMRTKCGQCGEISGLRRGRCGVCGAAIDISEIVRHQRRATVLRVIGEEWYWWLVEIVALALIALVVLEMLPLWTLAVVTVFLLRPLSRLLVLAVRGGIHQLPG